MNPSFIETIFSRLEALDERPILHEVHGDKFVSASARELLALTTRARDKLRHRGLCAGDRVAFVAANSIQWVAFDLALLAEGLVGVPLYTRQAPSELAAMIRDCDARLVVCGTRDLEVALVAALPGTPTALLHAVFDGSPVARPIAERAPDAPVTLIYTSGTSGDAKGVTLNRSNVDFMLPTTARALEAQVATLRGEARGEDRVFHYLPFCFAGSRIVLWTCLYRGNPLMLSTSLEDLATELRAAAPNYFLNVPALLDRIRAGVEQKVKARGAFVRSLYQRGRAAHTRIVTGTERPTDRALFALARTLVFSKIRAQLGPALEFLICGSAPLHEDTQRFFEMLGLPVYQVYGLTETTAIVTMDRPLRTRAGFVGQPIDGVAIRVADDGELQVRGPNVFAGYWARPDATREAFDGEWFRTGDQVERDDVGRLRIVGRVKNLLVPTSGHNVAPEPIEAALLAAIAGATHVVVVGHGRPFLTAIVAGAVDRAAVKLAVDAVNETLPHYRRVRSFHVVPDAFTPESGLLTANQKLKRRAIESHFAREVEAMYA